MRQRLYNLLQYHVVSTQITALVNYSELICTGYPVRTLYITVPVRIGYVQGTTLIYIITYYNILIPFDFVQVF
jgi:hypothetical protein